MKTLQHIAKMIYGRICHAIWMKLPDGIAFSKTGLHFYTWAGYWANMDWKRTDL